MFWHLPHLEWFRHACQAAAPKQAAYVFQPPVIMSQEYWEVQNHAKVHEGDVELDKSIIASMNYREHPINYLHLQELTSFRAPSRCEGPKLSWPWRQ